MQGRSESCLVQTRAPVDLACRPCQFLCPQVVASKPRQPSQPTLQPNHLPTRLPAKPSHPPYIVPGFPSHCSCSLQVCRCRVVTSPPRLLVDPANPPRHHPQPSPWAIRSILPSIHLIDNQSTTSLSLGLGPGPVDLSPGSELTCSLTHSRPPARHTVLCSGSATVDSIATDRPRERKTPECQWVPTKSRLAFIRSSLTSLSRLFLALALSLSHSLRSQFSSHSLLNFILPLPSLASPPPLKRLPLTTDPFHPTTLSTNTPRVSVVISFFYSLNFPVLDVRHRQEVLEYFAVY